MRTAKIFTHRGSQCVRLPGELQLSGDKVFIQRHGDAILLVPCNKKWEVFLEGLSGFSSDFMQKNQQQAEQQPESDD
ncbi:MAG: hypothetical protein GQF41_2235 [Candidatus Rifleibacterium amylolyticum]|nr:MAG: hypothetical protein GQF41_2235 [Candidatus Rifleibacterium amylolyticum]